MYCKHLAPIKTVFTQKVGTKNSDIQIRKGRSNVEEKYLEIMWYVVEKGQSEVSGYMAPKSLLSSQNKYQYLEVNYNI